MSALPALPLAPLPETVSVELRRVLDRLEPAALWWLSGYAAALAEGRSPVTEETRVAVSAIASAPDERLTVIYGSQTGNSRRVAEALVQRAEAAGLPVRLLRADAYAQRELKTERLLAVVISTQGDGDPPDDARGLIEFLDGKRAPQLPDLKYSVLALGDSSYPKFCEIGRRLDARLAELGASRLAPLGEADVDVDTVATPWLQNALERVQETQKASLPTRATVTSLRVATAPSPPLEWTRDHPFSAEVLANQRITARDGTRDVRHMEISLEGSGLRYEPGDALGVWPTNPPLLVDEVLDHLRLDGDTTVTLGGESQTLRAWITGKRELTRLSRPFVAAHAALSRSDTLQGLLEPDRARDLGDLLQTHQVIDVLHAHPAEWQPAEFVAALRPLLPRLYSIASSPLAVGDEAHLTVAKREYTHAGQTRLGAASSFLAAADEGTRVPVFIERNERFRLPDDDSRDLILIGPGTGVAPFRGFVQARAASGARGRNWLFFGNPHFERDFLYQLEWQAALKGGSLHRLDLAFSRDQKEKIYVQQRLRERGRALYDWLERGAHLYVCGDAARMAKDVHAALIDVIAEHGGKTHEGAAGYLASLQQQGRYARDVY